MTKGKSPLCLFRVFDLGQDSSYRPPTMGKKHEDTSVHLAATVSFGLACVMEMT